MAEPLPFGPRRIPDRVRSWHPDRIVDDLLLADETVFRRARPDWWVVAFDQLGLAVLGVVVALVVALQGWLVAAVLILVSAAGWVLWRIVDSWYTRYVLTDFRVLRTSGVLERNEVSQHVSQPATDQPQYYQGPGGPSSPDEDGSLFQAWWRTSLAGHVWERTTEVDPSALPAPAEVLVDQITTVYGRGIALARQLASDAGVAFASFFQPAALYDSYPWVEEVRAALPTGTIDLADALDGPGRATYFDAVHTNEAGARLVAEAMYPHLTTDIAGPS